jgi:hypothetical protein
MKIQNMEWTFLIQSNSRAQRVKSLLIKINTLRQYNKKIKIIISDNGNQGEESFKQDLISFQYIDNSMYKDAKSHVDQIFNMGLKNFFYIHDDDEVQIENLLIAMDFIQSVRPICLISPKLRIPNIVQFKNINEIFNLYFLSYDNNCPLFSGIYMENTSYVKEKHMLENLIDGKYADVQFVSRLLLNTNSYLFNLPYLNYIEHDSNDNKIRNLSDRIALSKFIRGNKGVSNFIISLLVFHGYKQKISLFILGVILAIFYPPLSWKIIKKIIKKITK